MLNAPMCLFKLLAHSQDTNAYQTEVSSKSPSQEQTMGGAQYYTEP